MNDVARSKYREQGHDVEIVESFMQTVEFEDESLDLIISVNALNNAPPPRPMLSKVHRWLKKGGYFFLVDFGREIDVVDWTWFLVKHLVRTYGLIDAISIVRRQAKVISINQKGKSDQKSGTLWTHSTEELLGMISDTGLDIEQKKLCYRDYADLVVAKKPESN